MLEEPYRWVEAIRNRREYLEDQLQDVSPVVGMPYSDGVLLLTTTPGPRKIFEVYDHIAFAGVGHPADMEKLRRAVIDLAHVEAYNLSGADVSVHRLVSSGIGPLMKSAFDEISRSPFIARLLLAEINAAGGTVLYAVDADGSFAPAGPAAVVGGSPASSGGSQECAQRLWGGPDLDLDEAVHSALQTWACGRLVARGEEAPGEIRITAFLGEALSRARIEAAVLDRTVAAKTKFRLLGSEELSSTTASYTS